MNHYLLIYDTAPDYLERRGEFRAEHQIGRAHV